MIRTYIALETKTLNVEGNSLKIIKDSTYLFDDNYAKNLSFLQERSAWKTLENSLVIPITGNVVKTYTFDKISGKFNIRLSLTVVGTMPANFSVLATLKDLKGNTIDTNTYTRLTSLVDTVHTVDILINRPYLNDTLALTLTYPQASVSTYLVSNLSLSLPETNTSTITKKCGYGVFINEVTTNVSIT